MGAAEGDHIRFRRNQAGLLDALLAAQPEVACDEAFARVRSECALSASSRRQPAGFVGQLRDYQREGLGWLEFLRRFAFGGCLADDMGVGKTAQVLALLETRRELRARGEDRWGRRWSSFRGRWCSTGSRRPRASLRNCACSTTPASPATSDDFAGYDLVLTTYGTLRRDALRFKDVDFDYVVLDEAQAIKNAGTESAKAVRLLRGNHRLALSGTPVENHLGELWSLFEFLNPGMLGAASVFKLAGGQRAIPSEDARAAGQRLRPFILRRTKEQVAPRTAAKTEQTVYCEMEPRQRKLYNELREHYRDSLLRKIESEGIGEVQDPGAGGAAASAPGGLPSRPDRPKARRRTQRQARRAAGATAREVIDEGHKALVFSQFTSLLAIVRDAWMTKASVYEYLDGETRDRQARVERFQNDPDCRLFLISLKAGGLGLNLTAAEYVFLLDPWWNPAVEAQAIDRAHRIGQTRQVFAYRLIARDTVEEKVLELQKTKRDLADAIIGADNSLIRDLCREDLELLLS